MTSLSDSIPNTAKKPLFKVTVSTQEIIETTTLLKKKRKKGTKSKKEEKIEEFKPSKIRQSEYRCVYAKPPLNIDNESLRLRYKYFYSSKYYQIIDDVSFFMLSSNGLIITMSPLNFIHAWSSIEPYEKKSLISSNPMIKFICEVSNLRLIGYSILKEIFIWSIESFKLLSTIQTTQAINYFKVINDGKVLMHSSQSTFIWNFSHDKPQLEYTFFVGDSLMKDPYKISQIKPNEIISCYQTNILIFEYIKKSQVKNCCFSITCIVEVIKSKYDNICGLYSTSAIGVIDSENNVKAIELFPDIKKKPYIVNMIEMKQGMFVAVSSIGELSFLEVNPFQIVLTCLLWKEELTLLHCLDDGRLVIFRNKEEMICTFNHELPRTYTNKWINAYVNRKQIKQLPNEKVIFLRENGLNTME